MIQRFALLDPNQLWISAIVAAELRFGALRRASTKLQTAVEAYLSGFDVKPLPLDATHQYAQIRASLKSQGKTIGNMDLMIAAHAMAEDSVVVTNNAREFHLVPGLAVKRWTIDPG